MLGTKLASPKLKAELKLDGNGQPAFVDRDGRRHYRIKLMLDGTPKDTYAVTWELDPSYYNSVREATNRDEDFALPLTSYGDYTVVAAVRGISGAFSVREDLSQALARNYANAPVSPAIAAALQEIASH